MCMCVVYLFCIRPRYGHFDRFESFHRFSVAEFYLKCIGRWVSPLTMITGFHPQLIKMCSMHTVHLGVCQWVNGSAILGLCDTNCFGTGQLAEKLAVLTQRFNAWCRVHSME